MSVKNVTNGIYGGLAGGLVMSVMMAMGGALPMIGKMIGVPSAVAGFIVHMVISAVIGAGFVVLFARYSHSIMSSVRNGLFYGAIWWVLGPLTLMPLFLGMGVNWSVAAVVQMLPSLMSHLIFGAILGVGYGWLQHRGTVTSPGQVADISTVSSQ